VGSGPGGSLNSGRVPLEASRTHISAGLRTAPVPDPSTRIEATILVRRRSGSGASERLDAIQRGEAPAWSREEAEAMLAADPRDLDRVAEFAAADGLTVIESSLARRSVRVAGSVAQMEAAFGVRLQTCEIGGRGYICYEGPLSIPAALDGIIVAVLGLDQRPAARR
jgi:kumamolisin